MIKRLFDHEQVEIVERSQMLLIRNGVGAVGIDGKQDVWVTPPHFSHHINIPTGFYLELDSLITLRQVSIDAMKKLIERGLYAKADTYRDARAPSSDQLR